MAHAGRAADRGGPVFPRTSQEGAATDALRGPKPSHHPYHPSNHPLLQSRVFPQKPLLQRGGRREGVRGEQGEQENGVENITTRRNRLSRHTLPLTQPTESVAIPSVRTARQPSPTRLSLGARHGVPPLPQKTRHQIRAVSLSDPAQVLFVMLAREHRATAGQVVGCLLPQWHALFGHGHRHHHSIGVR